MRGVALGKEGVAEDMILFFDTETTGLPDLRQPMNHPCQPHLVQLACLLTEDDGTERASVNLIVNPGIPIPPGAAAVHGITDDIADRAGIPPQIATSIWHRLAERADLIVAHNIKFDIALIEAAWARHVASGLPEMDRRHGSRGRFCTMDAATPLVNLPPTERMVAAGFNKPKPPKLEECIRYFFKEELVGAHDALVDVRACARLFFRLREMKEAA